MTREEWARTGFPGGEGRPVSCVCVCACREGLVPGTTRGFCDGVGQGVGGGLKTISVVDKLDFSCVRARGKKLPITDDNADE